MVRVPGNGYEPTPNYEHEFHDYGGELIAETAKKKNLSLILAAPFMLAALKEAYNEDSGGYSAAQVKAAILAAEPDAFDAEGYLK